MLAQSVPVGIDLNWPVTWFAVGVALVVVALTLATRRTGKRPRAPAVDPWSAAQALFIGDPRAGGARARAIVEADIGARGGPAALGEALAGRYRAACAIVDNAGATTDDLREAFATLQSVHGALRPR